MQTPYCTQMSFNDTTQEMDTSQSGLNFSDLGIPDHWRTALYLVLLIRGPQLGGGVPNLEPRSGRLLNREELSELICHPFEDGGVANVNWLHISLAHLLHHICAMPSGSCITASY